MVRYWVIAPYNYEYKKEYEQAWKFCFQNGLMSIGWGEMGDLTGFSRLEIRSIFEDTWGGGRSVSVQRFWLEIEPGDLVVARAGTKQVRALGKVTRGAFYDAAKAEELKGGLRGMDFHAYFFGVNWMTFEHQFPTSVFQRDTVSELKEHHKHWPAVKRVLSKVWDMS